ncbi:MAG: peptidase C69 [Rhodospirillaceae bacterium]|nr:MAG: peptidase C69 [Rhodospirillaceae bacterium]
MCDTLVALPSATADGSVIFAKNSDRPADEAQSVQRFSRQSHAPSATVRCTYIEIPQVSSTAAVLLSQPDWMWGAEMGTNEYGLVIGNEAVWTTAQLGPPALLGMDLVRLGLERSRSASNAVDVITQLLKTHGQGGACAENEPSFSYHNSFLLADGKEAWVLETAGQDWVSERVTSGIRNISNGLSIRDTYERCSQNLDGTKIDFAARFSTDPVQLDPTSREACAHRMMNEHLGDITVDIMKTILSNHESGICMHGEFSTTASMISQLSPNGEDKHWMTGAAHPCQMPFHLVAVAL